MQSLCQNGTKNFSVRQDMGRQEICSKFSGSLMAEHDHFGGVEGGGGGCLLVMRLRSSIATNK